MIKRYFESYEYESGMYEADDGEWVKWEDVKGLIEGQISKLNIKDDDVLVIRPLEGMQWSPEQAEQYFKLIREVFKKDYDNVMVLFVGDSKIEIKYAQV
jgi:hypothetical protein